jgi:hypothetical protein
MPFDLIGPSLQVSIELYDELLFDVTSVADLRGPEIRRLEEHFYDAPRFEAGEAQVLADEFKALLNAMRANPRLAQEAWSARPNAFRRVYPSPIPGALERKCIEIIAVCEAGARSGHGLRSLSD